jgi:hypothetical protein
MLSNTEERKPRPSAVCHDASGNSSTGISDALVTSASRKIVPLKVSGMISQSGRRSAAVARITTHTASPITGTTSSTAGNFRLATTLDVIAMIRIAATMPTWVHSIVSPRGASFRIGEWRCCCSAAGMP